MNSRYIIGSLFLGLTLLSPLSKVSADGDQSSGKQGDRYYDRLGSGKTINSSINGANSQSNEISNRDMQTSNNLKSSKKHPKNLHFSHSNKSSNADLSKKKPKNSSSSDSHQKQE